MEPQNPNIIHSIDSPGNKTGGPGVLSGMLIGIAVVAGVATGYFLKSYKTSDTTKKISLPIINTASDKKVVQTAGLKDETAFPDKAEGLLKEGGIEGEGAYHLERKGGESQNVYLNSTTVDLEPFLGKTIRVWGKTYQGEKAGWLMDVGYVELLQ